MFYTYLDVSFTPLVVIVISMVNYEKSCVEINPWKSRLVSSTHPSFFPYRVGFYYSLTPSEVWVSHVNTFSRERRPHSHYDPVWNYSRRVLRKVSQSRRVDPWEYVCLGYVGTSRRDFNGEHSGTVNPSPRVIYGGRSVNRTRQKLTLPRVSLLDSFCFRRTGWDSGRDRFCN